MTNFCQACGGAISLHFSTIPGCRCVNPPPINYVINQPIKREWVGMTDEEIAKVIHGSVEDGNLFPYQFAKAIEQALKEKNT